MARLITERLVLRDYISADLADLHRLMSDKKNMYFLDDIATSSIDESMENLQLAMANADGHYFCIRNGISDEYVGSVGYTVTVETPLGKVAHMGYFLLPEHHGHGYATEAAKAALNYAFTQDGCIRITTGCYKDNVPSRKVIEKVGFRKEAERIKAQFHDGKMKDRLEYAINVDDFLAKQHAV